MLERSSLRETAWHTRAPQDVVSELNTDAERGLSEEEARERLGRYGPNRIRPAEMLPWWRILLRQFTDPLIYILLVGAAVTLLFQEYVDAAVILAVVVVNGTVGFIQEFRARKAILALAEMSAPKATVVRDGQEREIPSDEVVPGDVVVLAAGNQVPADVRLTDAQELAADESALTGESAPVAKQTEAVEDERAVPGDQISMAFAGTNVTRGKARGVVVRTGYDTELGRIAEETESMAEVETPLQQKMQRFGKLIGVAVVGLALLTIPAGLAAGMDLEEMVGTAIALAVAAIPEALPIVLTVTLAVGVRRMAKRNAIIRSLPAVETLGSTTVICADKTGTLTRNEMTVKVVWAGGERWEVQTTGQDSKGRIVRANDDGDQEVSKAVRFTLLAGVLANEAKTPQSDENGDDVSGGDPTEVALLVAAATAGLDPEDVRGEYEQLDIIPFESQKQFMATINATPRGTCVFLKGSPEAVVERCASQLDPAGEERELDAGAIVQTAESLADEGLRVLGMAMQCGERRSFEGAEPGADLAFTGLQGMADPVRPEAVEAVKAARRAGIRVIMLTGDHARTARAIGGQLSLADGELRVIEGRELHDLSDDDLDAIVRETSVYARVSPEHKLELVERLKAQGHVVAVTGDGVNDAPALQAAHLGVAMGRAGTDVARQAADVVLADDNFASITNAVEEGRIVFANIRKVTYFLLSTAFAEVTAILSSLFAPWPPPFVTVQVLWINFVTSALQDLALALEPGEPGLLHEKPRDPREQVVNRFVLRRTVIFGLFMAIATLSVFLWVRQRGVSDELMRSVAMTQLIVLQFFHVFNCRSFTRSIFRMPLSGNPYVFGSVILALAAHLCVLHVPVMQRVFGTTPLSVELWGVVVAVGFSIIIAAEIDKAIIRRHGKELGKESGTERGEERDKQPAWSAHER